MIEVSHVSKNFGDFHAVRDISFKIPKGQIVGLLGPNGAGKTTTMRMITGFFQPDSGQILIEGQASAENPVEAKRKIGYMPESAPLYGEMLVEDYLRYVAQMHGQNPSEKIPLLCKMCSLSEVMAKNIGDLSRGYRQRVGLAHALMNDPEILILDEPTSGLDPNQIGEVRALIKEIGKTRTVIISTHILGEVEMLADRVIIISGGKIVADSPTSELRERYGHAETVKILIAPSPDDTNLAAELEKIAGVEKAVVAEAEQALTALCVTVQEKVSAKTLCPTLAKKIVESGYDLYELYIEKNSIEDVFHELTQTTADSGDKTEAAK